MKSGSMSLSYSPAGWIWEYLNADSIAQIGPVCLCYLIPAESRKECLLIHLCASTPAEGSEFSVYTAQCEAHGYTEKARIYDKIWS